MIKKLVVIVLLLIGWTRPVLAAEPKVKLTLQPEKVNLEPGKEAQIRVELKTGETTIVGVDGIIKYDPQVLVIKDVVSTGVLPNLVAMKDDPLTGVVKFALTSPYQGQKAVNGVVALIRVQSLKKQNTSLTWVFKPGSTTDTNVVGVNGKDLLESAEGGPLQSEEVFPLVVEVTRVPEVKGVQSEETSVYKQLLMPSQIRRINYTWGLIFGVGLIGAGLGLGWKGIKPRTT